MTFGEWIQLTRRKQGRTGLECAKMAKTSPQFWSRWENDGKTAKSDKIVKPDFGTVEKIAAGLCVPVKEAMTAAFPDAFTNLDTIVESIPPGQSQTVTFSQRKERNDAGNLVFGDGFDMEITEEPIKFTARDRELLESLNSLMKMFVGKKPGENQVPEHHNAR